MSSLTQIENSVQNAYDNSLHPVEDIMSIFIVERWDARHGKHSAHVHMSFDDVCDVRAWLAMNARSYSRLRNAVEDTLEIFPGIPFKWLIEELYLYF